MVKEVVRVCARERVCVCVCVMSVLPATDENEEPMP